MATRGLIRFAKREEGVSFNEHPENVEVQIYNHYDSYPEGLGLDLAKFMRDFRVVNGLGSKGETKIANGYGCLAAQIVAHFKDGPGDIYLYPWDGDIGDSWEEYIYTLYPKEGEPTFMSIYSIHEDQVIFVGTPKDLQTKYDD